MSELVLDPQVVKAYQQAVGLDRLAAAGEEVFPLFAATSRLTGEQSGSEGGLVRQAMSDGYALHVGQTIDVHAPLIVGQVVRVVEWESRRWATLTSTGTAMYLVELVREVRNVEAEIVVRSTTVLAKAA